MTTKNLPSCYHVTENLLEGPLARLSLVPCSTEGCNELILVHEEDLEELEQIGMKCEWCIVYLPEACSYNMEDLKSMEEMINGIRR